MICAKCGATMAQTDKNTMTGRVIREYECRSCGHADWKDDGVALWKVMHDASEQDAADNLAQSAPNAQPEAASPASSPRPSLWQRLTRFFLKHR